MSKKNKKSTEIEEEVTWRSLFDDGAVDAALDLFLADDPAPFIAYAKKTMELLEQFVRDHGEDRPDVRYAEFEEPWNLHRCLSNLEIGMADTKLGRFKARHVSAETPTRLRKLVAADPIRQAAALVLIERFEAFQAEHVVYLNPLQLPKGRSDQQQRIDAANKPERVRILPARDVLRAKYERLVKDPECGRRKAISRLQQDYTNPRTGRPVSQSALRNRLGLTSKSKLSGR